MDTQPRARDAAVKYDTGVIRAIFPPRDPGVPHEAAPAEQNFHKFSLIFLVLIIFLAVIFVFFSGKFLSLLMSGLK